jgi:hypothetical protein
MLVEAPPKFSPRNGTTTDQIPATVMTIDVQIGTTKRRMVNLLFDELSKTLEQHLYVRSYIYQTHYNTQSPLQFSGIASLQCLIIPRLFCLIEKEYSTYSKKVSTVSTR